jgi:hypothetical protein
MRKIDRYAVKGYALAFVFVLLLIIAKYGTAQEVEVRHYQTEIHQREDVPELYQRLHLLVGADGRAAVVVELGPAGRPPLAGGASGEITASEEEEDGTAAFCFTADDAEGTFKSIEGIIGRVSCWVWFKETDEIFETGSELWGTATSPILTWCGEKHGLTPPQPGARVST